MSKEKEREFLSMAEKRRAEQHINQKRTEAAKALPGDVVSAIELFLKFGDETKGEVHNGYYSKGGWPYNILTRFLERREENQ
jgi:hypothetical protein